MTPNQRLIQHEDRQRLQTRRATVKPYLRLLPKRQSVLRAVMEQLLAPVAFAAAGVLLVLWLICTTTGAM